MNSIAGIRITPKGYIEALELDDSNLLQSLYGAIDCEIIQVMELRDQITAIFDEEGRLTGAEPNVMATVIAETLGFRFLPRDYLCGSVIFLGFTPEGMHVSLTLDQRRAVLLPTE